MGIGIGMSSNHKDLSVNMFSHLRSSSTAEKPKVKMVKPLPNPKPDNYQIIRHLERHNKLVIEIQYLDCTNYEGRKILYFENCTLKDLKWQKLIDPHFCENKDFHSPVARFEPTDKGWNMAMSFLIEK